MTMTKVTLALALLVALADSKPLLGRPKLPKINFRDRVAGDYRLPTNSVPISYDISLVPHIHPGDFGFDGKVRISLHVLEPSYTVTLHTDGLTYDESLTTLESEAGISQAIIQHSYVPEKHSLTIVVANELPVGKYTLSFTFVGTLADDGRGFYRSSYTNASGDTVWLATTQFQPTSARRAFPCYDEPALKATFDIAIKHEPSFHALSNMPIKQTSLDANDGKIWTKFETTPVMSTYSVAFVISDFVTMKNSEKSYNGWAKPNAIDEAQWAFRIGSIELAKLEEFTHVTYKIPKMDQIFTPDRSDGPTGNWGLVIHNENMLYFNEETSTLPKKQNSAMGISHEFSHQWFGNLVTPSWWKYLWLSEGFANYFEWQTTDAATDNWRLMDQFVIEIQQLNAFTIDATGNSHPLNQDVASPDEINAIFDDITYAKGACIIRMMSHFLTEDVFRAGLTKYLNANAYSAVDPDDLFEAMQGAANEAGILPKHANVKNVMDTWVEQMGYPVVTITRNYDTGTAEVTQERFLSGKPDTRDQHDYKWWIPLSWASQTNPDFDVTTAQDWVSNKDQSKTISGLNVNEWVIFNKQQAGYYRVNYDDTNWGMIASYLNSDNYLDIHVLNRAALIDDAFHLAEENRLSYSVVVQITRYLQREVDFVSWYPAFNGLNKLHSLLANANEYESVKAYLSLLLANAFDAVGVEETDIDDHASRLNRANAISYACEFGLKSCRFQAEGKLVNWLHDSTASPLSPSLQSSVICAGLRSADATVWNKVLHMYRISKSATEKAALLSGLGCSEDEDIINNWLNTIIDPATGLSNADSSAAFLSVIQKSVYNVDRAFDFIASNIHPLVSYFNDDSYLESFVWEIASRMTTQTQLNKLNAFVAEYSTILGPDAKSSHRLVEENIAWNAAHAPEITKSILAAFADSNITTTAPGDEITTLAATTSKATTLEATTSKATTLEATTSKATTLEVTTSKATTLEVTTSKATTSEATTLEATTSKATTSEATTSEATTLEATTSKATTSEATTAKATTAKATTSETTTSETTTAETTTAETTTSETTTLEPSSAASTHLSFFSVALVFLCLIRMI